MSQMQSFWHVGQEQLAMSLLNPSTPALQPSKSFAAIVAWRARRECGMARIVCGLRARTRSKKLSGNGGIRTASAGAGARVGGSRGALAASSWFWGSAKGASPRHVQPKRELPGCTGSACIDSGPPAELHTPRPKVCIMVMAAGERAAPAWTARGRRGSTRRPPTWCRRTAGTVNAKPPQAQHRPCLARGRRSERRKGGGGTATPRATGYTHANWLIVVRTAWRSRVRGLTHMGTEQATQPRDGNGGHLGAASRRA